MLCLFTATASGCMNMAHTCQPLSKSPRRLAALRQDERAGIELASELADFLRRHGVGAEVDHLPHFKILKVQEFAHA
jgi:hypothetical protein